MALPSYPCPFSLLGLTATLATEKLSTIMLVANPALPISPYPLSPSGITANLEPEIVFTGDVVPSGTPKLFLPSIPIWDDFQYGAL